MRSLQERAERIGREAVNRTVSQLAEKVAALLPRASIETMASGLSIRGSRLRSRWLSDPELRFMNWSAR